MYGNEGSHPWGPYNFYDVQGFLCLDGYLWRYLVNLYFSTNLAKQCRQKNHIVVAVRCLTGGYQTSWASRLVVLSNRNKSRHHLRNQGLPEQSVDKVNGLV